MTSECRQYLYRPQLYDETVIDISHNELNINVYTIEYNCHITHKGIFEQVLRYDNVLSVCF